MIETGDDVRRAREALGLSQSELADRLRLGGTRSKGAQYVRDIEQGRRPLSGPLSVACELLLKEATP